MKKIMTAIIISSSLTGCSIVQTVTPVDRLKSREICIINNPAVSQPGFLTTYERLLQNKGLSTRLLDPGASITDCKVTSTYTANWRWDMALYMAYADIKVYVDGQQSGHAEYNALEGGGNMGKFIRAEEKIEELVNLLFPAQRPESAPLYLPPKQGHAS